MIIVKRKLYAPVGLNDSPFVTHNGPSTVPDEGCNTLSKQGTKESVNDLSNLEEAKITILVNKHSKRSKNL